MSDFNVDFDALSKRSVENGEMIPTGSDREFSASFSIERVPNFEGTDFTEVPHLRLQAPGNTKAIYHQPVRMESHPGRPSDPERFPQEWAAFQAGQNHESGTSIYSWEGVNAADARRFDLYGVKTVEQLAHVSDVNLQGLGVGAMALRERARQHISGEGVETQLRGQLAEQSEQITKLTDIVNAMLEKQVQVPPKEAAQPTKAKTKETING